MDMIFKEELFPGCLTQPSQEMPEALRRESRRDKAPARAAALAEAERSRTPSGPRVAGSQLAEAKAQNVPSRRSCTYQLIPVGPAFPLLGYPAKQNQKDKEVSMAFPIQSHFPQRPVRILKEGKKVKAPQGTLRVSQCFGAFWGP